MTFGFDSFGMYYSNLSYLLNSRTAIILFLRMSTSIKRLDIMVYVFEYLKIHISAKISITISLMRMYLDIDIGIGDSKYWVVFHFPNVMCTMKHFNCSTLQLLPMSTQYDFKKLFILLSFKVKWFDDNIKHTTWKFLRQPVMFFYKIYTQVRRMKMTIFH